MSELASVAVDPRVELMSVIFRLAGNPEYSECNLPRYDAEIEGHFAPFRYHPAVTLAAELREKRHVRWAAPVSLAVHLADAYFLAPRMSFDPRPTELDERWQPEETSRFLEAARDFMSRTAFVGFTTSHQPLYQGAARRMHEALAQWWHFDWFHDFFGGHTSDRFHVVIGMLTGQNSYGVSCRGPDVTEIYAVQAVYGVSDDGLPVLDQDTVGCIAHEFSHAYVTPMIHEHADEFRGAGERLFPPAEMEKTRGYGSWLEMTHETVVRACEMRYYAAYLGEEPTAWKIAWNTRTGFHLVGPLSDLLADYEADRQQYPTLEALPAEDLSVLRRTKPESVGSSAPAAPLASVLLWRIVVVVFRDFSPETPSPDHLR